MNLDAEGQLLETILQRDRHATIWRWVMAAAVGVVIIAQGLMVWAWLNAAPELALQSSDQPYYRPSGSVGGLQTVTLVNGQVFHGTLAAFSPGRVVLRDVFQAPASPAADAPAVVRRATTDPSGAVEMALPADKILFMEPIGTNSPIGRAINEAARRQAPAR